MRTITCLLLVFAIGSSHSVCSQVVSTMPATQTSESFFLYEVKLVDEFIERFNDDPASYIRTQCRALYGTDSMITRPRMLRSLFDKKQNWGSELQSFVRDITDASRPQYLSFTDSNWYAEANCIFLYNGKKTQIHLLLHIKTADNASKWMIAGMGPVSFPGLTKGGTAAAHENSQVKDFIPTSAYGTDFVVFHNVFSPTIRPVDYFEPALAAMPRAQELISGVQQGKAVFQRVANIKFHFFSLPGWVFTVGQFKRKETNSGWLISSLMPVTPEQKEVFRSKLLYP